ncbi:hypothetical protein Tco_1412265, partial [Tanacetum coccineum]
YMTRRLNSRLFTLFVDPERQFQARRDITPISVHNIFSFYEFESSESESEEMVEVDIETLTMEQYLALAQGNQRSGVVRPEIGDNVNFKIKGLFLRELKDTTFFENKNDDAYEHMENIL